MNFFEAFKETIFRFDLTGNEIAERSGLTPAQVSDLRNGKNLRIDSVQKILDALKPKARNYMLDLLKVPEDEDEDEDEDSAPLPKHSRNASKDNSADSNDEPSAGQKQVKKH